MKMNVTKVIMLVIGALAYFCFGVAFAATGTTSGIGAVASHALANLPGLAKLITAGSYVGGLAFGVGAIIKFKAHKDNPTQVHLSQGVVLLFVAAAMLFLPSVFLATGGTMFGSGPKATISGLVSF